MRIWCIIALIVLCSSFSSTVLAQKQSQQLNTSPKMILTGVVYDINGSVIVGAKVLAENSNGLKYETTANDEGIYSFGLPLASYKIEVSASSFCTFSVKGFKIVNSTHKKMSLDFVLDVADSDSPCLKDKWEKLDKELDKEIIINIAKKEHK